MEEERKEAATDDDRDDSGYAGRRGRGPHRRRARPRRHAAQAGLRAWKQRAPPLRLRTSPSERTLGDDAREKALAARAKKEVAAAARRAEEIADPARTDMFDFLYATLSPDIEAQRSTARTSSLGVDPTQLDDARSSGIEEAV